MAPKRRATDELHVGGFMDTYWDSFLSEINNGKMVYAGSKVNLADLTLRQVLEMFYMWCEAQKKFQQKDSVAIPMCPKCGETYPVRVCENCGSTWDDNL